jgi:hypothetical protein
MTADDLHVITLRADGWSLMHSCDPPHCPVWQAASEQLRSRPPLLGRHPVHLDEAGRLIIEERNVWLDTDRPDPATLPTPMTTGINRLGWDPPDPREVRPDGWGRGR